MIYIADLNRISDGAFIPFATLTKLGNPITGRRFPRSTLCQARDEGRLRVYPTNRTATCGRWLKAYLENPRSKKYGAQRGRNNETDRERLQHNQDAGHVSV